MTLPEQELTPDFWKQVYSHCQYLDETECTNSNGSRALVIEHLNTLVESFDKSFDPADDFEEFMVLMLCKSILRKLE